VRHKNWPAGIPDDLPAATEYELGQTRIILRDPDYSPKLQLCALESIRQKKYWAYGFSVLLNQ
jgi:hypothetical protein